MGLHSSTGDERRPPRNVLHLPMINVEDHQILNGNRPRQIRHEEEGLLAELLHCPPPKARRASLGRNLKVVLTSNISNTFNLIAGSKWFEQNNYVPSFLKAYKTHMGQTTHLVTQKHTLTLTQSQTQVHHNGPPRCPKEKYQVGSSLRLKSTPSGKRVQRKAQFTSTQELWTWQCPRRAISDTIQGSD